MIQDIFTAIRSGASVWIGDGGSTKAHWMAFSGGILVAQSVTKGFNPHHHSKETIADLLATAFAGLIDGCGREPVCVGYFGSGCSSERICNAVTRYIIESLTSMSLRRIPLVETGSDIVLACNAVAGREPCLTGILGTGSNTVVWDGERITLRIAPLGYLLGDEGSGASIGRRVMADVLRGRAPVEIASAVCAERSCAELQEEIYQSPAPAALLADAVKTASEVESDNAGEYMEGVARTALKEFFENIVDAYPRECYNNRLCFTGSIAVMYRYIIEELAQERGLTLHKAVRRPLDAFLQTL